MDRKAKLFKIGSRRRRTRTKGGPFLSSPIMGMEVLAICCGHVASGVGDLMSGLYDTHTI